MTQVGRGREGWGEIRKAEQPLWSILQSYLHPRMILALCSLPALNENGISPLRFCRIPPSTFALIDNEQDSSTAWRGARAEVNLFKCHAEHQITQRCPTLPPIRYIA